MNFEDVHTSNNAKFNDWKADGTWEEAVQKLKNRDLTLQHQILKALSKHGVNTIKYHVGVLLQFLRSCLQQRAKRALLQLAHENKYAKIIGRCAVQYLKRRSVMLEAMIKHWNDMVHLDATNRSRTTLLSSKTHDPLYRLFLHKTVSRAVKYQLVKALYSQRALEFVRHLRRGIYISPPLRLKPEQLCMVEKTKKQLWIQKANDLASELGHRGSTASRTSSLYISLNSSTKKKKKNARNASIAPSSEGEITSPISSGGEDSSFAEADTESSYIFSSVAVQPSPLHQTPPSHNRNDGVFRFSMKDEDANSMNMDNREDEDHDHDHDDGMEDSEDEDLMHVLWGALPNDSTPLELYGNATAHRSKPKGRSPSITPLPRYHSPCPRPPRAPSPNKRDITTPSSTSNSLGQGRRPPIAASGDHGSKKSSTISLSEYLESTTDTKVKREAVKFVFPSPREAAASSRSPRKHIPSSADNLLEPPMQTPPIRLTEKAFVSSLKRCDSPSPGSNTGGGSRVSFQSSASDFEYNRTTSVPLNFPSPSTSSSKNRDPPQSQQLLSPGHNQQKAKPPTNTKRSRIITEDTVVPGDIIEDFLMSPIVQIRPLHQRLTITRPRSHLAPRPPSPTSPKSPGAGTGTGTAAGGGRLGVYVFSGAAASGAVKYCCIPSIPSMKSYIKPPEGLILEGSSKPKFSPASKLAKKRHDVRMIGVL